MGLYDRPYWRKDRDTEGGFTGLSGVRVGLPRPTRAVKYLLIVTLVAFLVQVIFAAKRVDLGAALGVTLGGFWQPWRYLTFQFLHAGVWHIGMNMLVLYMFGSQIEREWGTRRLVTFYLSCGAAAGVAYVAIAAIASTYPHMAYIRDVPLIGASGGGYGLLLACAVLFPHMRILFLVFPMSMRTAAIILFGIAGLYVLGGWGSREFWSHVAHLGGAALAAGWLWGGGRLRGSVGGAVGKVRRGAWERKMQRRRDVQTEVDRILRKIHQQGLASLTRKEKQALQDATRRQQREDNELMRL